MVKSIGQILTVKWTDGRITHKRVSGWADLVDLRMKFDDNPKVMDTEVHYDI
jgi:hypothetical protein